MQALPGSGGNKKRFNKLTSNASAGTPVKGKAERGGQKRDTHNAHNLKLNNQKPQPQAKEPTEEEKVKKQQEDTRKASKVRLNSEAFGAGTWYEQFTTFLPRIAHSMPNSAPSPISGTTQSQATTTKSKRKGKSIPIAPPVKLDTHRILTLKNKAQMLYDSLVEGRQQNDSDLRWMQSVLKSGTATDKIAATIILVQQAPIQKLHLLSSLIAIAAKRSRRECLGAMDSLKDLFTTNYLPERNLLYFHQQPVSGSDVTDDHLVAWYFEDQLKKYYSEFIDSLEAATHDTLIHCKDKALKLSFELLCAKPEQEQRLLSIVVNKLGDREKKVASKATHLLTLLLEQHPNMKLVIAKETENFLHRPNVSDRSRYYAIVFLNQIPLEKSQTSAIPDKLISIYFSMFSQLLGIKKGEKAQKRILRKDTDSKMLSALLTGVNRAFPYTETTTELNASYMELLFNVVKIASFNKAIPALQLIYQIMSARGEILPSFYTALYAKLYTNELGSSISQAMFMNLLFKSIKRDTELVRVIAFIKRLLQKCFHFPAYMACGILLTISEVVKEKPVLRQWLDKVSLSPFEPEASHITLSNHLLTLWSQQSDTRADRESDEESASSEEVSSADESDEEEEEDDDESSSVDTNADLPLVLNIKEDSSEKIKTKTKADDKNSTESKTDRGQAKGETELGVKLPNWKAMMRRKLTPYNPTTIDPLEAGASLETPWELALLSKHFHPTVSKWATSLLEGDDIVYSGDPIRDFQLVGFLDRFAFKKPKKGQVESGTVRVELKTGSIMQPSYVPYVERAEPVNSASFLSRRDVRPDEAFFYQYFTQKAKTQRSTSQRTKDDIDVDDVDSAYANSVTEEEIQKIFEAELDDDFYDESDEGEGKEGESEDDMFEGEPEGEDMEDSDSDSAYDKLKFSDLEEESDIDIGAPASVFSSASDSSDDDMELLAGEGGADGEDMPDDFADAEEFAHLLESSGDTGMHHKQLEREARYHSGNKRKRNREGGTGGGRRRGRGGWGGDKGGGSRAGGGREGARSNKKQRR